MTAKEDYPDLAPCHNCGGDGYEPTKNYTMTYTDYVCGPRTCGICYGRGTFSQMEDDEAFDRAMQGVR